MSRNAFLSGYEDAGALDSDLLLRRRTLARLRLACIHGEPRLAGPLDRSPVAWA